MGRVLSRNGQNNEDGSFDWRNALADAGVSAGLSFFATLGATMLTGVGTTHAATIAAIAAGSQFFATLATKRGLREKQ